ncbi:uncharacterized protein [Typha angustifolia]|uniref:uncharacterized protein n=1 Tax=Typha angustifolia TaxID=59011 RepID=UPI003C30E387
MLHEERLNFNWSGRQGMKTLSFNMNSLLRFAGSTSGYAHCWDFREGIKRWRQAAAMAIKGSNALSSGYGSASVIVLLHCRQASSYSTMPVVLQSFRSQSSPKNQALAMWHLQQMGLGLTRLTSTSLYRRGGASGDGQIAASVST